MGQTTIIIALLVIALVVYRLRARAKGAGLQPATDAGGASSSVLPIRTKENDKIVVVKEVSYPDLKSVLTGFCNMYNKERYKALPRLVKLSEREFAVSFPYDIDFEIYCYFINYLGYPMELEWKADVLGWTTTKGKDEWISAQAANKRAMLFVSDDDTEGDNVYMTTSDNTGYKLGFAVGEQKRLEGQPKRRYTDPGITLSELTEREFEDFR